jgi:hypothetical protein
MRVAAQRVSKQRLAAVDHRATGLAYIEQPRSFTETPDVRMTFDGESDIPDNMRARRRPGGVQRRSVS